MGRRLIKFDYPEGATPLEPEELYDLIPVHIATQEQLNAWEQKNIVLAENWARFKKNIVSVDFIQQLHKHMFGETWKWAGKFRRSGKNIGIDWHTISSQLKLLLDDIKYQLFHKSYEINEIAARFYHRLVFIHPFANGNGRHARLVTDRFLISQNCSQFSWGQKNLYNPSLTRKQYIEALKSADKGNYQLLLQFVRE